MKHKTIATILAICLGFLGIHLFYLNDTTYGFLYLAFFWTLFPLVLSILDFWELLFMKNEAFNKIYNNV